MNKFCPDLVGYEDVKSYAISSSWENARVPKLHPCIKDECAAYEKGYCHKWNTVIEPNKKSKYFNKSDQTLDFKHFKLYSENTLKNMNKDELIEYIHMLHHNWDVSDEQLFNVIEKIKTLQDGLDAIKNPQPYKFEDLKELIGKPIFDYKYKEFYILAEVKEEELYKDEGLEKFMICSDKKGLMRVFFEEGRFFPLIKAMEYQGKAGDEK